MSIITVIGAGMMGSAIAIPAYENGHSIRLVGTHLDRDIIEYARKEGKHLTLRRDLPDGFSFYHYEETEEALKGADLVVCGVSSFGVDWFAEKIIPILPDGMPILSVTKGMHLTDDKRLITFPAYYRTLYPDTTLSFNAVGGPCTSYELADHDQTEVCFCGDDAGLLGKIRTMFETDYYHISTSTDVTGVEVAVAMKNAYALAVCLAVGMAHVRNGTDHENYNSQAALFGQSVREMSRLLKLYGGREENIVYGAGDLYVTIFGGRTRLIGTLLGEGYTIDDALAKLKGVTLESVVIATRTGTAVRKLIENDIAKAEDFPLMLHVDGILNEKKPVSIPWNAFEVHAE